MWQEFRLRDERVARLIRRGDAKPKPEPNTMKYTLFISSAVLAAMLSIVNAQGPGKGGRGGKGGERPSSTEIAKHLGERFAALLLMMLTTAASWKKANWQHWPKTLTMAKSKWVPLAAAREALLAVALAAPAESHPAKWWRAWRRSFFQSLVTYDKDSNNTLDETEQGAVAAAIDDGSLKLPRPGGPGGREGGEGGGRGGRGGRPEGPPPGQ